LEEKRGVGWDREGSVVVGAFTCRARERIHACGGNGPVAVWASACEEPAMFRARDEVFHFPIEAIIGDRFLEAEGADLRGLSWEARELSDLTCQRWARDRSALGWEWWKRGRVHGVVKRRKAEKMAREDVEGMEGHGINLLF
jgi:hypothetical protein